MEVGRIAVFVERDGCGGELAACGAVAFVYHDDEVAGAGQGAERRRGGGEDVGVDGRSGVDDEDDDDGAVDGLTRSLDADLLDGVVGVAQAGGVDEAEVIVAELDCLFDGVAGCAMYVADYGAVIADESVEQRRFAGVGGADDGYGYAVFDGSARGE